MLRPYLRMCRCRRHEPGQAVERRDDRANSVGTEATRDRARQPGAGARDARLPLRCALRPLAPSAAPFTASCTGVRTEACGQVVSRVDLLGYLASALVLAAFSMKAIVPLRVVAVFSNIAFILYGHLAAVEPVLLLHVVLLPMNLWRLGEAIAAPRARLDGAAGQRELKFRLCAPLTGSARAASARAASAPPRRRARR
jgi:hypothetical protein